MDQFTAIVLGSAILPMSSQVTKCTITGPLDPLLMTPRPDSKTISGSATVTCMRPFRTSMRRWNPVFTSQDRQGRTAQTTPVLTDSQWRQTSAITKRKQDYVRWGVRFPSTKVQLQDDQFWPLRSARAIAPAELAEA